MSKAVPVVPGVSAMRETACLPQLSMRLLGVSRARTEAEGPQERSAAGGIVMTPFDLDTVAAKGLTRLSWRDLLTEHANSALSTEEVAALEAYFRQFTSLAKNACPGCELPLTGDLAAQLFGNAGFTWGIANGEGYCSRCGYPARAYHRDIGGDLIAFLNFVLPYHPDELRRTKDVEVA